MSEKVLGDSRRRILLNETVVHYGRGEVKSAFSSILLIIFQRGRWTTVQAVGINSGL
jgi:hypothetical protein